MSFLIPSAKKTKPASNRTKSVAAGAPVFSKLKSVLSIVWYFDGFRFAVLDWSWSNPMRGDPIFAVVV
jgi:hypothetical protein